MAADHPPLRPLPPPPERIVAGGSGAGPIVLQRASHLTVDATVSAVNASLAELRAWMPWAAVAATRESVGALRRQSDQAWNEGREFQFTMAVDGGGPHDRVIGACGLHARQGPGIIEIGYWVRTDRTGRGVATAAAAALLVVGRSMPGVEEIQIRCDRANVASAVVAERLGLALAREEPRPVFAPAESGVTLVWVLPVEPGPVDRGPVSSGR